MAMEAGGRADKLGNEYERLWVVRQLLLVLQGEAHSVLWEGLGDNERGVEVWVGYSDGKQTAYQCKRQNGSKGNWSVSDLQEVLKNAEFQLGRDSKFRFGFVSSDSAPYLRDLVERTGRCDNDPAQYIAYQTTTSQKLETEFGQICKLLGVDKTRPEDQQKILNFLKRLEVCLFDDNEKQGRAELRVLARSTVDGDASSVITALEDYATQQIGNKIYIKEIRDYLRARSFQPRNLSGDPQIQQGIENLQKRFHKSLNPSLINGTLIKRPETEEIINKILAANDSRVMCLHGKAGQGKSGVLYELKELLNERKIPYLPLRLDRQHPTQSIENFGKACGLPSSPGLCLKILAGERKAILILDQLDAIRWTSAHSSDAWDIFEELVEECLSYKNLCVVVACRTFDFNEDPRIKAWKTGQSSWIIEVKVGELPEKEVAEIVKNRGTNWAQLSTKQKEILRSPANLYLWTQLETIGQPFRTATDLMKAYWKDLWENKIPDLKVKQAECWKILEALVDYMDKNGRLVAPDNIAPQFLNEQKALISLNVLTASDGNVVFSHQGYFDYLVAHKVLSELRSRKADVVTWLEGTDQSLFRRDQLRNVLTLLRDEDENTFCKAIEAIITSKNVRFHLKHLVLNFLGNIDIPLNGEVHLVIKLLEDLKWYAIVKDLIIWNKSQWFKVLYDKGIINKWLHSDNKEQTEFAINLMGTVLPECSVEIYESIKPLAIKGGIWLDKVASALFWKFGSFDECNELFAMRIRLMRAGVLSPRFLHWSEITKKNPRRCLLLFRVCISRLVDGYRGLAPGTAEDDLPKLECLAWHDIVAISEAAKKEPKYAWRSLTRFWFSRGQFLIDMMKTFHRYDDGESDEELLGMREKLELPLVLQAIEKILTNASEVSGRDYVGDFIEIVIPEYEKFPNKIKKAVMVGLSTLSDKWADKVMLWFSEHPSSFKLRRGYYVSCWNPAERIIERFSPICSAGVFETFEKALMTYREGEVKENYKDEIEIFREYNYIGCNENGRTQYVLLSKMPKERLSQSTLYFLDQLERKFAGYSLHKDGGFSGGGVGSPIPAEKLSFVSDEEWLRIIKKDWSDWGPRWKQMGPNHVGEASHRHFADDFGHVAEQQPQRFATLALRIPKNAYPGYLSRILRAIALTKPPDSLKQPEKDAWQPATGDQIEAVLDYVGYSEDQEQAISFCDLLEKRADAKWPAKVFDRLMSYATKHPDPKPDAFSVKTVDANKQYIPDVANSALNCVRGRSAMTMAKLLFEQRGLFSIFREAINNLVNDVSPAVRIAAMYVCLPLLNIDRTQAVNYFLTACQMTDDRIFEGAYADHFISYAYHKHLKDLKSLIERMARSKNPKVANLGAAWATAIWLRTGEMEKIKEECCCGSVEQRKGAAHVTNHWLNKNAVIAKHIEMLKMFFNDKDIEVRGEAAGCFREEENLHIPEISRLAVDYVESPAFDDDPEIFFYGLDDYTGNLKDYAESLFKAGEKFAGPLADKAKNLAMGIGLAVSNFAKIMLRLYEQTYRCGDKQTNERCLLIWDKLLESGIVDTHVLQEIES